MSYASASIQNVVEVVRANTGRNGGGATRLNELTDVNPNLAPTGGDGLVYVNGIWTSQVVVSNAFNLGPIPEASVYRDITDNGMNTNTMNFRQIAPGSGISLTYSPDDNYIVISGGVASAKFVDLVDVAPMTPQPNQALHYNAVTSKWEQVEELKVDATTRKIDIETLGAIAILGDGAVGVQSLTDSIALAGAVDANLTAATGDVNVTAIAADVRVTANADIYLDATSGGIIDASAANGMVLKADAGSVAITSLQDEVVINGKTGVSVLSGIGAPIELTAGANAGISLLAGVNGGVSITTGLGGEATIFGSAKIDLTTGTDGPIEMTTAGEGQIITNSFGMTNLTRGNGWATEDTVTGASCNISEVGSGIYNTNQIELSCKSDGIVVSFTETPSVDTQTLRINSAFTATSTPALYAAKVAAGDGNVIPNRQYVDDAIGGALPLKASIGGDVVSDASTYELGTVSGNAESTRFMHNGVSTVNQNDTNVLFGESTVALDINGTSGNMSLVNTLDINTQVGALSIQGKDGLNLTSDTGPIFIQCLNESIDIAAPQYMTLGTLVSAFNMSDIETLLVRDGNQRLALTDTLSTFTSPGGDVEIECEAVSGVIKVVSGTADDYAAKVSTISEAVPNVRFVENQISGISSYVSGGVNDFQYNGSAATNSNAIYHNATTYSAVKNITQVQFWVTTINGNMRIGIYNGWDTTATLISQTAIIVAPTIGLNTATFITPFDLGALQNIVIGVSILNNTLKIMGSDGLNVISQSWNAVTTLTGGFLTNPGTKLSSNNTRAVLRFI